MSQMISRLQITDICDELSEDLRRELIEKQVICISKLDSNRKQFYELKDEIKRLKSDLKFANKCLKTLNDLKRYLNEIRPKIESILDLKQKQELNALENEYQIMIKTYNQYIKTNTTSGSDSVIKQNEGIIEVNSVIECDHNYYIKEEIVETTECSNSEDIQNLNSTEDESIENTQNITKLVSNDENSFSQNSVEKSKLIKKPKCSPSINKMHPTHHDKLMFKFKCDDCNYRTNYSKIFENHKRSHLSAYFRGRDPLICELCDKQFKDSLKCSKHFSLFHKDLGTGMRQFECQFPGCEHKFKHKNLRFKEHMDRHLKDSHLETFKCQSIFKNLKNCEFQTKDYNELKRHELRKHSKLSERQQKCTHFGCGKAFYFLRDLRQHITREHSIPVFKCLHCEKKFSRLCRLKEHSKKTHKMVISSEKSHKYKMTDKEISEWKAMTHDGCNIHKFIPGFICRDCHKRFNRFDRLKRHLIRSHKITVTKEDSHKYRQLKDSYEDNNQLSKNCEEVNNDSDQQIDGNTDGVIVNNNENRIEFKTEELNQPIVRARNVECTVEGCHKLFNSIGQRDRHLKVDHNIVQTYSCDYPNCDFVTKSNLDSVDHKYIHTGETPYACDWVGCGYTCGNRKNLRSHKYKHKYGPRLKHSTDRPVKCEVCHKFFRNKMLLKCHNTSQHSTKQFKCTYAECDQLFKNPVQRNIHLNVVHLKKYRCDWPGCDHVAANSYALIIHMNGHTGQTPYVCDWPECGFVARTNDNLKHHKYRHTGERPYPCTWPECGKRFRTEAAFSTHMRLHNNDRCYSCEWSGCEFATHDRSHLRTHRFKHRRDLIKTYESKSNGRVKVVIKSNNNLIKKSINKRNIRKPKRYESDSDFSDSE